MVRILDAVALSLLLLAPATLAQSPREPFATKHAQYVPVDWHELPGWPGGVSTNAWSAFLQGCKVLMRRPAWEAACQRASHERAVSPADVRQFFEREFEAFQVRTGNLTDTGILTGYFEPFLEGSAERTARFQYPVYGVPQDLLFLDARLLPPGRRGFARIEGRDVIPVRQPPDGAPLVDVFRLDLANAPTDLRDRRIRVRQDGDRIAPYFTRQQIEQNGLQGASALAWVDNPDLLYILHIQGSGRIRLGSGQVLRVAFGEQNGHPFIPKVRIEGAEPIRTRGIAAAPAGPSLERSAEVQRMIDLFLAQAAGGSPKPPGSATKPPRVALASPHQPKAASSATMPAPSPQRAAPAPMRDEPAEPQPRVPVLVTSEGDPSYVFFRPISDTGGGPPGALGVPLTPRHSLAVDPRVTPLGAPVFIEARRPGSGEQSAGLMVAQDTGGAIRGAVRADYFWGFGPSAGAAAMRMKDELRMWILLPKGLDLAARHTQLIRTRGLSSGEQVECLLADPELCVE